MSSTTQEIEQEIMDWAAEKKCFCPSDLEDHFCGVPPLYEQVMYTLQRWRLSKYFVPFCRLVNKGAIVFERDPDGHVFYALPGYLPSNRKD